MINHPENYIVLSIDNETIDESVDITDKESICELISSEMENKIRDGNGYTVSYDYNGGYIETGHPGVKFTVQNYELPVKTVCDTFERLLDIFSGRVEHLDICTTLVGEVLQNIENFPSSCDILCLNSNVHSDNNEIIDEDHGGYLRPCFNETEEVTVKRQQNVIIQKKRVDKLLEIINVKEGLIFEGAGRPWSDNKKIRTIDYLCVEFSSKLSTDEISQLENKIIYLKQTMLIDEDINIILKDIKCGKYYKNLEILTFEKYEEASADWIDWKNEILNGLEANKWDEKERSRNYHIMEQDPSRRCNIENNFIPSIYKCQSVRQGIDLSEAYDFIMDNGNICSVMFDELILSVFIWHGMSEYEKRNKRKRKAEDEMDDMNEKNAKK